MQQRKLHEYMFTFKPINTPTPRSPHETSMKKIYIYKKFQHIHILSSLLFYGMLGMTQRIHSQRNAAQSFCAGWMCASNKIEKIGEDGARSKCIHSVFENMCRSHLLFHGVQAWAAYGGVGRPCLMRLFSLILLMYIAWMLWKHLCMRQLVPRLPWY